MRRIFSRGAALLTVLAMLIAAAPCAMAQNAAGEEEAPVGEIAQPAEQPPVLEPIGDCSEGMIRVFDGTLWGYAFANGTVVIQPCFDAAEELFLGIAQVTQEGKMGLLHWNGDFLLKPEYDELTNVGYGIYLGKRANVWDLITINPISAKDGLTHLLYSDQTGARLVLGAAAQLSLQAEDGTVTTIPVRAIPGLLEELRVPGWQFPLNIARKASFVDVSGRDWFDRWVNLAYSVGLMEGTGNGKFEPLRTLTVAEALRLASCLESRALQDDFHLQSVSGPLWYRSSVTYCEASGVIEPGEFGQSDYTRPVTRAEMAHILSATTPVRGMEYINDPEWVRGQVPDVNGDDFAAGAIYALYAKGILNGTDPEHSFHPDEPLTRAEAAAIVSRIARPEQRMELQ